MSCPVVQATAALANLRAITRLSCGSLTGECWTHTGGGCDDRAQDRQP